MDGFVKILGVCCFVKFLQWILSGEESSPSPPSPSKTSPSSTPPPKPSKPPPSLSSDDNYKSLLLALKKAAAAVASSVASPPTPSPASVFSSKPCESEKSSPEILQTKHQAGLPKYEIPEVLQGMIKKDIVPAILRRFATLLHAEDYYFEEDYARQREQVGESLQPEDPTQQSEYELLTQSVGGEKKGRVYGLRSAAEPARSKSRSSCHTQQSAMDVDQIVAERVAAAREELAQQMHSKMAQQMRVEMAQHREEMSQQMVQQLSAIFQKYGFPPQPP